LREPGDVTKGFEARLQRVDGDVTPVEVASARTSWGGKPAFQVIMRDVSERKLAEEEAQARMAIERRYAAAVAALEEGVVVVDRDGAVAAANDSAVRILGRRLEGGRGDGIFTGGGAARKNDTSPFPAQDLPLAVALSRHEGTTDVVIGVRDEHGQEQWLSVSSRPIDDAEETDAGAVVCSVSDITERKHMLDRLAWEARNDPLTSLANRSGFLAAVEAALEVSDSERDGLVMFFFDLDRFKLVNDSLGHAVGDEVLRAMAQRLRTAMPRAVSLSRLHGDEFAALEVGVPDTDAALHRAEELRSILSRPVQLSTGRTLTVTPSIGLVRLADVGREASEVLQDADMAMLQAKTRGRGRVAIFDAGLREEVGSRLELEHDLRAAVENGELRLEYQPLASLANGRVLGLEALVRWEHPRRGLLLPGRFVGLAEESELIIALGQWVLEAGCAQMARWRAMYPEANDSFLAVNVSPRQFDGSQLLPAVRGALEKSGLPPGALMLEITESGIVSDDVRLHGMLGELREFGDPSGHRRLRHRLLVTELSEATARQLPEDRPVVRDGPRERHRRRAHRGRHHRPRPRARIAGHRRGRREPPAAPRGPAARMRPLPGVPAGRAAPAPGHPAVLAPPPSGARSGVGGRPPLRSRPAMKAGRGGACVAFGASTEGGAPLTPSLARFQATACSAVAPRSGDRALGLPHPDRPENWFPSPRRVAPPAQRPPTPLTNFCQIRATSWDFPQDQAGCRIRRAAGSSW
jgi:diguanylate cyclase (GGDEF)-like protein/PAS domain S-box-containing protein